MEFTVLHSLSTLQANCQLRRLDNTSFYICRSCRNWSYWFDKSCRLHSWRQKYWHMIVKRTRSIIPSSSNFSFGNLIWKSVKEVSDKVVRNRTVSRQFNRLISGAGLPVIRFLTVPRVSLIEFQRAFPVKSSAKVSADQADRGVDGAAMTNESLLEAGCRVRNCGLLVQLIRPRAFSGLAKAAFLTANRLPSRSIFKKNS